MSSEVCPHCGKTYKRLKSHLSHCKAAPTSKTAPGRHDVTAKQSTSPSQLDSNLSKTTGKGKKSASVQTKEDKTLSLFEPVHPITTTNASSPPLSSRKKRLKVADQIKTTSDLLLSPPLPPTPPVFKTKKKSLRALIEAANSQLVTKGSLEGTGHPSEDLPSDLPRETKPRADADNLELFSADIKAKDALNKKVSKSKKAAEIKSSDSLDSKAKKSRARPPARDNFWVESEEEVQDLSANAFLSTAGSGEQVKITLQNVKATLARAKTPRKSSKIETTDILSSEIRLGTGSSLVTPVSRLLEPVTLTSISPHLTEVQTAKKKPPKSKQAALIQPQNDASPQPQQTSPPHPLLSQRAPPPVPVVSLTEGLKVAGLLSKSPLLSQFSSPLHFPLVPQTKPGRVEKLQLEVQRPNYGANPTEALAQQHLGQVKLRELPEWLALKTPNHPREVVDIVQRGWQWYYRRYIDVKKGGVAGLGMLLAGYCVLSYIWSFPHTKHDRWRKYH